MTEVRISEKVAAPAAAVWELLGDFGGLAKWCGPVLSSCIAEGSGVGAVRTIGLPGGKSIRERLEGLDSSSRTLRYSIVGESPIPVRGYLATCRVVETGPSECRVDWESRFEPDGVSEEEAQRMVGSSYSGSIERVRRLLGASPACEHGGHPMEIDGLPLISADSHVEEPPTFFTDRLPASMHAALGEGMGSEVDTAEDFARRIGASMRSFARMARISEGRSNDAEGRLEVMREDGIAGECVFPTRSLPVWTMSDADAGRACCQVYNDWICETLEVRSPRFRCAALIPTFRVDDAIAEVERAAKLGLGAAMLPLVGTPDYNRREWEPLWSCIEESGLPVVMHQGTGHDMLFHRGRGAAVANLLATQSMAPRTAALLATSGVLADHPKLHFVFVETNAAWIAWAMTTLDFYYDAFLEYEVVRPLLPEKPSFYLARQIHGTFQVDPVAVANWRHTGTGPLLWGSDFPHAEGTYPNSRATVRRLFEGVEPDAAAEMVAGNAARLFRFPPEVLTTPV